jgi:hypothetical protein
MGADRGSAFLCQRLERMGFRCGRLIRLYGEEFQLLTGPSPAGKSYEVLGVSRKSGSLRHLLIPLSLVRMIEREFTTISKTELAA